VELTWAANPRHNSYFMVRRDGVLLSVLASTVRTYLDFSVQPGRDYTYCIVVIDIEGMPTEEICDTGRREIFAPRNLSASKGLFEGFVMEGRLRSSLR
jgi:hypothetical protein